MVYNCVMTHSSFRFSTSDGVELHTEVWTPSTDPSSVVYIHHGNSEHIGRYAHLAERLNARGAIVVGPDRRGQGKSGGPPGHVDSFTRYAVDAVELRRDLVRDRISAELPWFIFGHSAGGLCTLVDLLEHGGAGEGNPPIRGAVVSAPLLGLSMKVNRVTALVARLLDRVAPKVAVASGIPPEFISRDSEVVRAYDNDNRRVRKVTVRWASAMEAAIARVGQEVDKLSVPMLWYVGSDDKICEHRETLRVFEDLAETDGRDQTMRVFDGYYHELHNEPEELREPVLEMIENWISARV